MPEWTADVVVDEAAARRLIRGQFPELAPETIRQLGKGWDNTVWLVDERWVFRFPRREIALRGFENELAILPRLAPLLPLPIPAPSFVGHPDDGYPWQFFGAELVPGREVAEADLAEAQRSAIARPLAAFLRTLHGSGVIDATDSAGTLPVDANGRTNMARRVPMTLDRLAEGERAGLWRVSTATHDLLETALELPTPEPTSLVHGDLHIRHLLVAEDGRLAGVIDWGDVCVADPSIDLALVWSFFPPDGRADFLDEYGPVTGAQLLRARVLAISLCAILALYGSHERFEWLEREAVAGLERALETE